MIQEQIYKKDINRVIDGVIKADSVAKLKDEITEYVITGEQLRLLPRLFETLVPPGSPTVYGFPAISVVVSLTC
jgi:hypothetical protein